MELSKGYEGKRPGMVPVEVQTKRGEKRKVMDFAYKGDEPGFNDALDQARSEGKVTHGQYNQMRTEGREILRDPHYGPIRNSFRHADLGVAIRAFDKGDDEERAAVWPVLQQKWERASQATKNQHRAEYEALFDQ